MNLVKLIQSVEKQSNIYKNLQDDNEEHVMEWLEVAEECQITPHEAQDEWNLLLLEYMEYLKGHQNFTMSKYMDFLQPYLFTTIEADVIDEDELLNILNEEKTRSECYLIAPTKKSQKEDTVCSPMREEENISAVHENIVDIKNDLPTVLTQELIQQLPAPTNVASSASKDSSLSNLTSIDLIFLGYAKQLQNMPLPLQQQTKRKIAAVMDEAEMKMVDAQ